MRATALVRWMLVVSLGAVAAPRGLAPLPLAAQAGDATIEFLAIGSDGKPIPDLTAAQVAVKIDGKDRAVRSLKLVTATAAPAPGAAAAPAATLPPPFIANTAGNAAGGRLVVILFDEESIRPGLERPIRDALGQLLGALPAGDLVSFAAVPRGAVRVDPTPDRQKVTTALGQIVGRQSSSESADDAACRARDLLDTTRATLADAASGASSTTVVFISSALPGPNQRAAGGTRRCELTPEHFQHVGAAAEAAHAQFYVVQPDTSSTTTQEGLENLAGVTGGQFMRLSSAAGLNRIAFETSAYYIATIAGDGNDRANQGVHRLDVKVARDGVTVRNRAQVTFAAAAAPRPAGNRAPADAVKDLLKVTTPATDVPFRAAVFNSRGVGGKVQVSAVLETIEPGTKLAAASLGLIDGTKLTSSPADERQLGGSPIMISTLTAPGAFRIRVAVADATGRTGVVDLPVTADLVSAGPLKLSGLILGTSKGAFVPALQFKDEAAVVGYLEIYGDIRSSPVSARMEIAATPDGPALATVQPQGRGTSEPDKALLTAELPIASLAPGDYVVRAIVNVQGQPEGQVMRTLRKIK